MSGPISATSIRTPSAPTTSSRLGLKINRHHGETRMKHKMFALAALSLGAGAAHADIVRTAIPNSTFPIAQSVKVSGDAVITYVSGQLPPVVNKDVDASTPHAYGDVKAQTVGVLNR